MKILVTRSSVEGQDYQTDCLIHGLRSIYGSSVVDSPKLWYMYKNSFGPGKTEKTSLYGRGFTIFGTLDDIDVDRENIEDKIKNQYYDFIIMNPYALSPYINIINEFTDPGKIIWIDGHDYGGEPWIKKELSGHYFKREKITDYGHELSFAFPKEKIIQYQLPKTKPIADLLPGKQWTYIYTEEEEYYRAYNQSLFAITHKKNGWDCMRHYEIIASRCIPWFKDIQSCPGTICTTLPKDLLIKAIVLINQYGADNLLIGQLRQEYDQLNDSIFKHFLDNCLTEHLAKYVIDVAMSNQPIIN